MLAGKAMGLSDIKHVLLSLIDKPTVKTACALLVCVLEWVFGANKELVVVVFSLLAIDSLFGMTIAFKNKELSSAGFFRFASKIVVYMLLMTTAALVDKALPINFSMAIMCSFLAVTEGLSIMENVSILGFPVPSKLISKLKVVSDPNYKKKKIEKNRKV